MRKSWETKSKEYQITVNELKGSDWLPTPHGINFDEAIFHEKFGLHHLFSGKDVLELGAGAGNQSVLVHRICPKTLTMTEVCTDRLKTTAAVMKANGCEDNTNYVVADWLAVPIGQINTEDGKFDTIITNPPYCWSGKQNRRYFIDEFILNSHKLLRPGGSIIFSQSSMADLDKTLERMNENGFSATVAKQDCYPWRQYYFDDPHFATEAEAVPDGKGFTMTSAGRRIETLSVIYGTLQSYEAKLAH